MALSFLKGGRLAVMLSCLILFLSCGKDDDDLISIEANAGRDQTVVALATVTLDGSASIGGPNLQYQWSYAGMVPEQEINFSNTTTAIATFVPPKNGQYMFTLRVSSGDQVKEDQVFVTASGAIMLNGTLTSSFELKDIEPGPGADYRVTGDVTIPLGISITLPDRGSSKQANIVIEVDDNTGIVIDGGTLRMESNNQLSITSLSGWKGILLKSGTLALVSGATINKAAKSVFSGQTESAAITVIAGSLQLSRMNFSGSTGYDLLLTSFLPSNFFVENNVFTATKPIKTPADMLGKIAGNSFTEPYDYIVLTTPGAGVVLNENIIFRSNTKYYLDGDLTVGSPLVAQSSNVLTPTYVYLKPNVGIVASGGVNFGANVIFDGLGGANWKGIAIGNNANGNSITGTKIRHAGSALFNTGSFSSDAKAAIYYFSTTGNGSMVESEVSNSQGYGVYNATIPGVMNATMCTFTNTMLPAISTPVDFVHAAVGNSNSFAMTAGVAAVDVRVPNLLTSPVSAWSALGGSNYYLFSGNVRQSGGVWTLAPGVNLRFKAGKFLELEQGAIVATGLSDNPIVFDSELGAAGKWSGILVQGTYKFEYCQLRNGGSTVILKGGVTPATEKANLVFNYGGGVTTNIFKNNTITGSDGYGVLVEAGKQNPDVTNAANSNTLSNNASGNVIIK